MAHELVFWWLMAKTRGVVAVVSWPYVAVHRTPTWREIAGDKAHMHCRSLVDRTTRDAGKENAQQFSEERLWVQSKGYQGESAYIRGAAGRKCGLILYHGMKTLAPMAMVECVVAVNEAREIFSFRTKSR